MRILLALILIAFIPTVANAELRVDMTKGVVEPLPIAITPFYAEAGKQDFARNIPKVISVNLESSGLFKPVNPRAFVQDITSIQTNGPNFGEWRASGAQALVTGTVKSSADGRTRAAGFRAWCRRKA